MGKLKRYLVVMGLVGLTFMGCGRELEPELNTHEMANPLVAEGRWSALHDAVQAKHHERVAQLLKKGIDVNVVSARQSDYQITPFMLAAKSGDIPLLNQLVGAGADVSRAMSTGQTALHLAVENNDKKMVMRLIELGVKMGEASFYTDSPLEIARENGFTEVEAMLNKADEPP